MILSDFVLHSRVNQHWQYSGLDSLEHCLNKDHFQSYPHPVDYVYNSRGFRDAEWPESVEELKNAIWCVGDSFTVGIGQPVEHTWPRVLSVAAGRRCINISMDGASNDWIARKVQHIVDVIAPDNIVILWSYTHRREHVNVELPDEQRRILSSTQSNYQDYLHWADLQKQMQHHTIQMTQAAIPYFIQTSKYSISDHWSAIKDSSWPSCPATTTELDNLPDYIKTELVLIHNCYHTFRVFLDNQSKEVCIISSDVDPVILPNNVTYIWNQLDWARDYHHFDLVTSRWLVDQICQQMAHRADSKN